MGHGCQKAPPGRIIASQPPWIVFQAKVCAGCQAERANCEGVADGAAFFSFLPPSRILRVADKVNEKGRRFSGRPERDFFFFPWLNIRWFWKVGGTSWD